MPVLALLPNSLWFASCLPSAMAFQRSLRDVAGTQQRLLRHLTGCRTVTEFRDRFPLTDELGKPTEPILRRVPTSGTTGPTKLVPYTRSLLAEFQRGIAPWVVDLFRHNPGMLAGSSYWAVSPVANEAEGFEDDTAYLGRAGWLARASLAVPPSVRHIHNMTAWRRETVRHLVACRDLAFISVWHPSFLSLLLEDVSEPSRLWPNLRVISCWGNAPELAAMFPQATVQPKGLIATEGFVSVPLWGRDGAALAVRSHFFEFLDETETPRLAHELTKGCAYSVVLTTGGGLRRYRLHDLVRVTGFEQECPLLRFEGKENNVSDHFGEKVSEQQVRAALEGVDASFLLVACEGRAYTLYIETDLPDGCIRRVGEHLEKKLLDNIHYRYCRELGQLGPVQVTRTTENGHARYLETCRKRGRKLGDIKPVLLEKDGGWEASLTGQLSIA